MTRCGPFRRRKVRSQRSRHLTSLTRSGRDSGIETLVLRIRVPSWTANGGRLGKVPKEREVGTGGYGSRVRERRWGLQRRWSRRESHLGSFTADLPHSPILCPVLVRCSTGTLRPLPVRDFPSLYWVLPPPRGQGCE